MFAVHNVMPHAIESNEHITTAVQQAASGSQSCVNMIAPLLIICYIQVFTCLQLQTMRSKTCDPRH